MPASKTIVKPQVLPKGALVMTLLVLATTIVSFIVMMGITNVSPTKQTTQLIIAANAISILVLVYLSYATLKKLLLFKSKEKHNDLHTNISDHLCPDCIDPVDYCRVFFAHCPGQPAELMDQTGE